MEEFEAVGKAMIKPEQIPDEALKVAGDAYVQYMMDAAAIGYDGLRIAIAAALNAWPERIDTHPNNISHLVLQFKEKNDD